MNNESCPIHVGIVMDGNGRWAQKNGLSRIEGHRKGADVALNIIKHAAGCQVKYLTLYTFSSENWLRPVDEVSGLMGILYENLLKEFDSLKKNNVKLGTLGEITRLPRQLQELLIDVQKKTAKCTGLHLTLALSYGSRDEIVRACKKIAGMVTKGEVAVEDIDENLFSSNLDTCGIPDPDIIVRTSGENRLSNFLLWQSSYAELFFRKQFWPDFSIDDFDEILFEYSKRNRRYGRVLKT